MVTSDYCFRGILAPLVVQQDRLFSNFWGALSSNGYYSRSDDYVEIVERRRIGLWNVPFINSVFFIRNSKVLFYRFSGC